MHEAQYRGNRAPTARLLQHGRARFHRRGHAAPDPRRRRRAGLPRCRGHRLHRHQLQDPSGRLPTGTCKDRAPRGRRSRAISSPTPAQLYRAAIADIKRAGTLRQAFRRPGTASRTRCCMRSKRAILVCRRLRQRLLHAAQNTQEGFFADPLYVGNRNFAGWKSDRLSGPSLQLHVDDHPVREALPAAYRGPDGT